MVRNLKIIVYTYIVLVHAHSYMGLQAHTHAYAIVYWYSEVRLGTLKCPVGVALIGSVSCSGLCQLVIIPAP